ncbi:MAG: molybdopterin-binding protein, partial [Pirellulaceae bacterium]|nr:molybdopterin-binding protein [Pirellulaceae bacterium]
RPVEVGVLAESGRTEVKVYTQPTVTLLQTGDEVVETGAKLKPGQIRNSNGPMLSELVSQAGGKPVSSCLVGDNVEDLKRSVHEGLQQDFVPQVLSSLGVNQVFHKVNFRPGKPLWFGTYERCLVFGLPGNPISGLVSFLLFVAPAIATLVGHRCAWESWEQMATASLEEPFQLKGERPAFWPGVRSIDGRTVRALPWRGSADPYTLVKANCLISFPIGNCQYTVDEDVAVIALR